MARNEEFDLKGAELVSLPLLSWAFSYPSNHPSINLSFLLSTYLFIHPSIYVSIHLLIQLFNRHCLRVSSVLITDFAVVDKTNHLPPLQAYSGRGPMFVGSCVGRGSLEGVGWQAQLVFCRQARLCPGVHCLLLGFWSFKNEEKRSCGHGVFDSVFRICISNLGKRIMNKLESHWPFSLSMWWIEAFGLELSSWALTLTSSNLVPPSLNCRW